MALMVYNGPAAKIYAGGYVFKPGKPVKVSDKLQERARDQLRERGVVEYKHPKSVSVPAEPTPKK